jgi:hypothetical protein
MPLAPRLGMGRRSRSSPSLSNPTGAPVPANPNVQNTPTDLEISSPAESAGSATSAAPRATSPTASTTSSTRPRFLSRLSLPLSLPLRNRNRNIADFHIRAEEPHRRYSTGDNVRGAVVIVVVKPVRITHLTVSLHGYVRVLKDPTSVAKAQGSIVLPQNGDSARPRYHGNGLASLFQDEQVLSGEGRLEPGRYEFGFDLLFPDKGLPSSIDVGLLLSSIVPLSLIYYAVRARDRFIYGNCHADPANIDCPNIIMRAKGYISRECGCWTATRPSAAYHLLRTDIETKS